MLSLSGHIGTKASALVDGQLSPSEEERAWSHVLTCPGCRRLVEREGWVKRQLGSLSDPERADPPPLLLGSLYAVDAWATVDHIEQQSRRRRTAAVVVGGGALGACVLGLLTITGGPVGRSDVPTRQSPAMIRGDQSRGPVGSPTGPETNRPATLLRRSR
jgi:anti-sigma factor RsiW